MTLADQETQTAAPLSTQGFRALLDSVIDDEVRSWVAEAEKTERFPRALIERFGRTGVLADKWASGPLPDVAKLVSLGFALGNLGSIGISIGASLHDSAISILRRFGRTDYLRAITEQAIRGEAVLCIGASEEAGGSDLQISETLVHSVDGGYYVRGSKKFVSLGPISDHIVVVARGADGDAAGKHGNVMLLLVPTAQVVVNERYRKLSAGPLDTAPIDIDTWVPADALIARPGGGLAAISWGLSHERLGIAAQVVALCEKALGITIARMTERVQFGSTLLGHQALRLRVADLQSRVDMMRYSLEGIAATGEMNLRTAAAAKVTAARLGEEVLSECLHIFGGSGYLTEEIPVGRWWRDMKLARVGGGTDETLWEFVAAALKPDMEGYRSLGG
ncbi:alkylation response protein AidB-like acyl-CoA dehydrogenase [Mycobacteroides chelonae]|nr:alkylation response protein AidB-like acyl-CoA dehydrogenase [Mycobacteroides chelonae]